MYLIAGLGNPGREYDHTRHNMGFDTIDKLAEKNSIDVSTRKHKALCGKGVIGGQKVVLAKPQTYMNNSGESIREIAEYYKIEPENIVIIYDDITLDVGQLRVRQKGSAGGHNGMKSIIAHLGTQEFPRIRVGIGDKPRGMDLADYVLGHFPKAELENVETGTDEGARAAEVLICEGVDAAMNQFNAKR